jgi:hypothetical protein
MWSTLFSALDVFDTIQADLTKDIQEKNIMLNVEDESIPIDFEEAEISNSSPRKVVEDPAIYQS